MMSWAFAAVDARRTWRLRSSSSEPVSSTMRGRRVERSSSLRAARKCCVARISVGAMSAAWKPFSMATSMAWRATMVLPEPTSPWSRRRMGLGCAHVG
jgi:hypothetical protein